MIRVDPSPRIVPPAMCFALSAIGLGHALQINNGFFHPTAIAWVAASLVLALAGVVIARMDWKPIRGGHAALCAMLAAGICWQLFELFRARPGLYLEASADIRILKAGVVAEAVLIGLGLLGIRQAARLWFPAVLAINVALGAWMLEASPRPRIDVVTVHRAAMDALLEGENPYSISFENIYGADAGKFYNPAAIRGDRIEIAYPYPPLSLLLAIPADALAGDYRYAELASLIAAAALIGFTTRARAGPLAACLLLTTPRGLFVLEQGWTEPIAILLLAATVSLMQRRRIPGAVAAGLLIVTKQYLLLAGPAFLKFAIGTPHRRWRMVLLAGLAAAAATLPLALWEPDAFLDNVVWLQTREPFRADSLSVLSWAARMDWGRGSFLWAVGAACAALAVGLAGTPNTAAGFAATIALACLAMFAFGSKAFCNYYYFVIGALCCAVAAGVQSEAADEVATAHRDQTHVRKSVPV